MFEQRHPENRLKGCREDGSVGETMFSRSAPSIVSRNPAIKILLLARSKQFPKLFNIYSGICSEAGLLLAETDVTTTALFIFSPRLPPATELSFPASDQIPSLFSPKLHHAATSIFPHHVLQNPELSWPLGGLIWRFRSDVYRWETTNQWNKDWDH